MKEVTTFVCEICGRSYVDEKQALLCEENCTKEMENKKIWIGTKIIDVRFSIRSKEIPDIIYIESPQKREKLTYLLDQIEHYK